MPSRICVHLEHFAVRRRVVGGLEQRRAEGHRPDVRFRQIVDPHVQMDLLLLLTLRPRRSDVIGRELDSQTPLTVHDDAVPFVLGVNDAAEHPGPEGTLCIQVGSIENMNQSHHANDTDAAERDLSMEGLTARQRSDLPQSVY